MVRWNAQEWNRSMPKDCHVKFDSPNAQAREEN